MFKISASSVVGLIILMCILAAMVSIAIMQVVRTVEDIGPKIYIVGGAVYRWTGYPFDVNHPRQALKENRVNLRLLFRAKGIQFSR